MNANQILLTKKAKKITVDNNITMGTQTITEVKKEQTDKDHHYYNDYLLGTETHTFTKKEHTDIDRNTITLGTQTFTKTKEETTDSDYDFNSYKF